MLLLYPRRATALLAHAALLGSRTDRATFPHSTLFAERRTRVTVIKHLAFLSEPRWIATALGEAALLRTSAALLLQSAFSWSTLVSGWQASFAAIVQAALLPRPR